MCGRPPEPVCWGYDGGAAVVRHASLGVTRELRLKRHAQAPVPELSAGAALQYVRFTPDRREPWDRRHLSPGGYLGLSVSQSLGSRFSLRVAASYRLLRADTRALIRDFDEDLVVPTRGRFAPYWTRLFRAGIGLELRP